MKNKQQFFFIIVLIVFIGLSCKKKDRSQIPLVSVNIVIYVSDPQYFNLVNVSGWEYVTGGSRGVLVYRSGPDSFMAYERHCPYQPEADCARVEVDSTNISVFDACCGSKFLITDGSVLNGPAGSPLKQYQTSFDGTVLRIYN